ncbi:MAG: ergothioneine biosynthesis protein EgtB [Pseudomonadota bacterium]
MSSQNSLTSVSEPDHASDQDGALGKGLRDIFRRVRRNTLTLAEPLTHEDWMLQSMEAASPIKWHLAHTSWFFETFVLAAYDQDYNCFHTDFSFLFNSYYQQVGTMHRRDERGLLSRPAARDVLAYRAHVDAAMEALLQAALPEALAAFAPLVTLGIAHEEQHQELMQTDILHAFYQNRLLPAAYDDPASASAPANAPGQGTGVPPGQIDGGPVGQSHDGAAPHWIPFEGGLVEIGAGQAGFAFDNEYPRHKFWLNPFELAADLVINRDYLKFMAAGGYEDPQYWLSDGWALVQREGWRAPLYWQQPGDDGAWQQFGLFGMRPLDLDAAVRHVSYYEAAAYAAWAGAYLPTEIEWEVAAAAQDVDGRFLEDGEPGHWRDRLSGARGPIRHLYGTVWEWTMSPYAAYPGYKPAGGAIGEYNGKFMSGQMVLRGGSSATPAGHVRATYRNFFPPDARWQMAGIRLAR